MKKLIVLFSLCSLSINYALADNRYDKEIKLIEKNTADFIALSEKKLAQLDEILAAWTELEEYSKELTSIIKLRVHSVNGNMGESIKQLQAYNDEKTYVENTLVGFSVLRPKIEAVIKNITKLLDNVPSIKEKCQKKLDNVLTSLDEQERL